MVSRAEEGEHELDRKVPADIAADPATFAKIVEAALPKGGGLGIRERGGPCGSGYPRSKKRSQLQASLRTRACAV